MYPSPVSEGIIQLSIIGCCSYCQRIPFPLFFISSSYPIHVGTVLVFIRLPQASGQLGRYQIVCLCRDHHRTSVEPSFTSQCWSRSSSFVEVGMLSPYIVEVFVLACRMVAGSDSIGPACLCAPISAFLEGPTHLKRQLNRISFYVVHICLIQRVLCHCWGGICHRWLRIPPLRCLEHHKPLTWATTQGLRLIQSTLQFRYLLSLYVITSAIIHPARPLGEPLYTRHPPSQGGTTLLYVKTKAR